MLLQNKVYVSNFFRNKVSNINQYCTFKMMCNNWHLSLMFNDIKPRSCLALLPRLKVLSGLYLNMSLRQNRPFNKIKQMGWIHILQYQHHPILLLLFIDRLLTLLFNLAQACLRPSRFQPCLIFSTFDLLGRKNVLLSLICKTMSLSLGEIREPKNQ